MHQTKTLISFPLSLIIDIEKEMIFTAGKTILCVRTNYSINTAASESVASSFSFERTSHNYEQKSFSCPEPQWYFGSIWAKLRLSNISLVPSAQKGLLMSKSEDREIGCQEEELLTDSRVWSRISMVLSLAA